MTDLTGDQGAGAQSEDAAGGRLTPEEFQRIYDEANATMPSMSELIARWITPRGIVDLDPQDQAPDDDEEWDDPDDPLFGASEEGVKDENGEDPEVDSGADSEGDSDDAAEHYAAEDEDDDAAEDDDDDEDEDEDEDDGWECFDGDEDEDEFADQDHDSVCNCAAASAPGDWEQLTLEGADPAERGAAELELAFDAVRVAVKSKIEAMLPSQFIILEFRGDPSVVPFSQAAMNSDWIHCEVVSEEYLAAEEWPIDEAWLRRTEWRVPDGKGGPNWWTTAHDASLAAKVLVDGLRFGRVCPDPHAFAWRVQTFLDVPWK